ncbi:hypothetical protein [Xylocopilactobacillus apicola]|uniref:Uncharacterized protein n=1 Tax=Xylocopilactobacillus apicola TaxID=2932184 RepID=A0AAU9CZM5_9LACO|nr:hypothetical protein [Xylocopilactobacillus apicola]BDR59482.1 hypothetical protein XA3_19230 [Xylocopilactobacillus apicola]
MTKIQIDKSSYDSNVNKAKKDINWLKSQKIHVLKTPGTDIHPFVQAVELEKQLDGIIKKYADVASHDTDEFSKTGKYFKKTDQAIGQAIEKN